jgi:hypothetical protein
MAESRRPGIDAWDAIAPHHLPAVLAGVGVPWWVAGGWAIDLFAGTAARRHTDLDVLVLRRDQHAVRQHLAAEWPLFATGAGTADGLTEWPAGVTLEEGSNSVWAAHPDLCAWAFEIVLMDTDGERWAFRRDRRIGGAITEIGWVTRTGLPVLRPEIQLLFKARDRRPKDDRDFAVTAPLLDDVARRWLGAAIETHLGPGHAWLGALMR